jgi:hypothetical protein
MQRGFKTWAETKSAEFRRALGLAIHGYLPAIKLARHLGIVVVGPEQLPGILPAVVNELLFVRPDCWSAVTIPTDGGNLIVHNTQHALPRQESNLMHEMAHVIRKHRGAMVQCVGRLPWAFRTFDEEQEDEAKWLGACLQIPRAGLMWAINRGMSDLAVAEHFHASEALVRFRRNATGVDIQSRRFGRALRAV